MSKRYQGFIAFIVLLAALVGLLHWAGSRTKNVYDQRDDVVGCP
jgi:hypothetical protein